MKSRRPQDDLQVDARVPSDLDLDPETMRALGYRIVDLLVERNRALGQTAVWSGASREEMEARLREDPPEEPQDLDALLTQLVDDVLGRAEHTDHPRFFAYIPGGPTWPSVLGELIASGANIFQGTWLAAAGPSEIELVVLDWFKGWIGYPAGAEGLLVSGGSEANLTALACARLNRLEGEFGDAVLYGSSQVHSSVWRGARILGFRDDQLREIDVDEGFRIRLDALAQAIEDDERSGRRPFLVAANAGATSTGAVDPLPELAALCRDRGLWLHADAAYGGFATLTERGRGWLAGMERADSITLDPHKGLFQQWGTGCLLVRESGLLNRAFEITADYLQDASARGEEVNFADRGLQLTRPARALKIWLSLKYFGAAAFRQAIDTAFDLAAGAQKRIENSPCLELLSPATLGIVCFRRTEHGLDEPALEELNRGVLAGLAESGLGYISSTRLRGTYALRLCIVNYRTTAEDVDRVLSYIEGSAPERESGA